MLMKKAEDYVDNERFEEAVPLYQKILAKEPNHVEAGYDYAHLLVLLSRHAEAKPVIQHCIELSPNDGKMLGLLAEILEVTDKGNYRLIEAAHERAYQIDATSIVRLRNYAMFLEVLGKFTRAEALYREALIIVPRNEVLWFSLGVMYQDLHCDQDAVTCFENCLAINPNNLEVVASFATVLYKQSQDKNDVAPVKRAISMIERHPAARDDLVQQYLYCKALESRMEGWGKTEGCCAQCQKPARNQCKKCSSIVYCSKECQVEHWKLHKKVCGKSLPHPQQAPLRKICPTCNTPCSCQGLQKPVYGTPAFFVPEHGLHVPNCQHTVQNMANGVVCDGMQSCVFLPAK